MSQKKVVARLILEVEYEEIDFLENAKELVENARGYGNPVVAKILIPAETEIDLK